MRDEYKISVEDPVGMTCVIWNDFIKTGLTENLFRISYCVHGEDFRSHYNGNFLC
jgi:hypothetical protein